MSRMSESKRVEEVIAGALTEQDKRELISETGFLAGTLVLHHMIDAAILAACHKVGVTGEMVRGCVGPDSAALRREFKRGPHVSSVCNFNPAILLLPEVKGDGAEPKDHCQREKCEYPFKAATVCGCSCAQCKPAPPEPEPETVTVEAFMSRSRVDDILNGSRKGDALVSLDARFTKDVPVRLTLPAAPKPKRTDKEKIEAACAELSSDTRFPAARAEAALRILRGEE